MKDVTAILTAVRQAALLCQRVQQTQIAKADKGTNDPVTIADYGSQAILCRMLSVHYPEDGVISEERANQYCQLLSDEQRQQVAGLLSDVLAEPVTQDDIIHWLDFGKNEQSPRTWVIDPVDGTKGFLAMRHYAIAIGLVEQGQPTFGAIGAPGCHEGRVFYTLEDAAYVESLTGSDPQKIRVSQRTRPDELLIVESVEKEHASHSLMAELRERAGLAQAKVEYLDSMEKYALVACGYADLYLRLPNPGRSYQHKVWDHAAGVALVLEAGGCVTDIDGSALDFSQGATLPNKGMIVGSPHVHQKVIQVLAEHPL